MSHEISLIDNNSVISLTVSVSNTMPYYSYSLVLNWIPRTATFRAIPYFSTPNYWKARLSTINLCSVTDYNLGILTTNYWKCRSGKYSVPNSIFVIGLPLLLFNQKFTVTSHVLQKVENCYKVNIRNCYRTSTCKHRTNYKQWKCQQNAVL